MTFKDTTLDSLTAWNWSFGDGTFATVQNPVHTYLTAGNYIVKLTATNAAGNSTLTKWNYIIVTGTSLQTLTAAFSAFPTSGNTLLSVTFTDSSTGSPTAWNWNFGDGTCSTVKNPVHTYSTAGSYSVMLKASNAAGTGTKTRVNYIKVT